LKPDNNFNIINSDHTNKFHVYNVKYDCVRKNVPLYFCLLRCYTLADFQNSFTYRLAINF